MNLAPFIAVEGPIGVGKTSLAKALSKAFQCHLIKEIVEDNPFLEKFYENMGDYSFQTEMFFLSHRFQQLETVREQYLTKGKPIVADYHMFKSKIFAKTTLKKEHFEKYSMICHVLTKDLPMPNLIIYLKASLEMLLTRIRLRGRDIEKNISPDYLKQLIKDYEAFITAFSVEHPEIPILTFNGDDLNFIENQKDLSYICSKVNNILTKDVQNESKP
ncbi:deoxyguanosine kinase [Scopulibacillus darangshiensis]|uniref:Deoxyguanosine kinase n=1 Tax=Scopulibacillus darangshiensis TaxID=442528 RepID=A0A4R2NKT6_9BACL|nr:deoxynucleoside kinase [Scopulibacillus darangshiensis]TCP22137.1 deoxyguanosine kinase [Scopulibacillus darangshiensis]